MSDKIYSEIIFQWMSRNQNGLCITVFFFSFVIFYDDVTKKVIEIIDFRKKFLEGIVNAFYGLFYKNLNLLTQEEILIKNSKKAIILVF